MSGETPEQRFKVNVAVAFGGSAGVIAGDYLDLSVAGAIAVTALILLYEGWRYSRSLRP